MTFSHEEFINEITSEYPAQVKEAESGLDHPPVSEAYLYELCGGEEGLLDTLEDMLEYFYRYTADVCYMQKLISEGVDENLEAIREKEGPRTALHNSMIDSVKIFVRQLREKGKDTSWITKIDKAGRTGYANLALSMTFSDILHKGNHHEWQGSRSACTALRRDLIGGVSQKKSP